jgi:type II secretory pathway component GspD/PulD (secretin)
MKPLSRLLLLAFWCAVVPTLALAQGAGRTAYIKPQYLPPAELARVLGVRDAEGRGTLAWQEGDATHVVEVRRNDAANLLMVMGAPADVATVEGMIKAADVAPRQIAIEARIVEVDENKALRVGIDWGNLRSDLRGTQSWSRLNLDTRQTSPFGTVVNKVRDTRSITSGDAALSIFDALRLLDEKGAATVRDAPRILTLNNRRATILDGQRVTYITRYSSFTNLFETDTLDAGLTLSVLPSLGESGYLTLDVRAELTSVTGDISGSPVKDGQIVENVVIARDGETVLLGGFLRTVEERSHRRFPVLGYVLPFLFSREISNKTRRESFVAITPRVVDLAAAVDDKTKGVLEGR